MTATIKPGKTVGIDLGTTRSCVAHIDRGKAVVIPNADSELVTPSVVVFEEDGTVLVGSEAKAQAVAAGKRTVRESKREIGRSDASWTFDGERYTPEMIGALVLKKLKKDAESHLGVPIVNAVITVPAYFDDSQRAATEAAGRMAGLNVLDILNEPVAAALAYGLDRSQQDGHIVVYDLGGGTFDVSVMKVQGGSLSMVATDGNVELGGKDWDQKIIDRVCAEFRREYGKDPQADLDALQALKNDCEAAKELLSRKDKTKIICQHEGRKLVFELTREEFDRLTEELLSQTENTLCTVVEDFCSLGWDDIHRILLVGGSSKMPQVPRMVSELTGREVGLGDVDPDLCVAVGAAYRAFMLEAQAASHGQLDQDKADEIRDHLEALPPQKSQAIREAKVTMVTSHAYGIQVYNEDEVLINDIMIEKNAALPVSRTKTFFTRYPGQDEVEIPVMEGEQADVRFCRVAGTGRVTGIPPMAAGAPISVTLTFTDRGIIEVSAREETHGRRCNFRIERQNVMSPDQLHHASGLIEKAGVQ